MRRLFKVLISTILVMNMVVMTAMAAPYNPDKFTSVNIESELLAPQIRSSRVTELPKPRGVFFSAADLIISDEGNGDVGVLQKHIWRFRLMKLILQYIWISGMKMRKDGVK